MDAEEVERLRRSFEDPGHWARGSIGVHAAQAQALLREHVLERLDDALASAGCEALLAKGGALAHTVYPERWMRPMTDFDLLVRDADLRRVEAALVVAGFKRHAGPIDRPLTGDAMHETEFAVGVGQGAFTVEVHVSLDKLVRRRVEMEAIMARAETLRGSIRIPCQEDHLLLVVLHAATADFDHAIGWLDLHLLLGAPLDAASVLRRARAWDLATALFVALTALRHAGSDRVPDVFLDALRPPRLRARSLQLFYDLDGFPVHGGGRSLGLPWALRQVSLRDDVARWCAGCGRYGALRLLDRALAMRSRS